MHDVSTREMAVSERQNKIKRLFFEAIRIEPIDQRRVFIVDACGDDLKLRMRLESLLQAHDRDETLIDRSAWESIDERFERPDER